MADFFKPGYQQQGLINFNLNTQSLQPSKINSFKGEININDIVKKLQSGDLKALEVLDAKDIPFVKTKDADGDYIITFEYNGIEYEIHMNVGDEDTVTNVTNTSSDVTVPAVTPAALETSNSNAEPSNGTIDIAKSEETLAVDSNFVSDWDFSFRTEEFLSQFSEEELAFFELLPDNLFARIVPDSQGKPYYNNLLEKLGPEMSEKLLKYYGFTEIERDWQWGDNGEGITLADIKGHQYKFIENPDGSIKLIIGNKVPLESCNGNPQTIFDYQAGFDEFSYNKNENQSYLSIEDFLKTEDANLIINTAKQEEKINKMAEEARQKT